MAAQNKKSKTVNSTLFPGLEEKFLTPSSFDEKALETVKAKETNIEAIPVCSQENLVLSELIYCLVGIGGSYIIPEKIQTDPKDIFEGIKFTVSSQVHISLRQPLEEILPLAQYYTCVEKFAEKANFSNSGQALQAFSRALKDLLQDYMSLLPQFEMQLDAGTLTLHKMFFDVKPMMDVMHSMAALVIDVQMQKIRGAKLLNLIYERINSIGEDEATQDLSRKLLDSVAKPFFKVLEIWIQKGIVHDPSNEFFVEDTELVRTKQSTEISSADYWQRRFIIREERVPCFMEKVSGIVLRTGKYVNALRKCGKQVNVLQQKIHLGFTTPPKDKHIAIIKDAHRLASTHLLDVVLNENNLLGYLNLARSYLLLHQGDFFNQYMDSCADELGKNVTEVSIKKLRTILDSILPRSAVCKNIFQHNIIQCELLPYDLVTQMSRILDDEMIDKKSLDGSKLTGFQCFTLRFKVEWPITLIIDHFAMLKYQMIFRQIFYLNHVDHELCMIWKEMSMAKKLGTSAGAVYRSVFVLRQRMWLAIQNLESYMMFEVVEFYWLEFLGKLKKVGQVDDILLLHGDFLDFCARNCMLTETTKLTRLIFKLCEIALAFCAFIRDKSSSACLDAFSELVQGFDSQFTETMLSFLCEIKKMAFEIQLEKFGNLVDRFTFDSYYEEQMDKVRPKVDVKELSSSSNVLKSD